MNLGYPFLLQIPSDSEISLPFLELTRDFLKFSFFPNHILMVQGIENA